MIDVRQEREGRDGVLRGMRKDDPRQYYEEYGFTATPEQYGAMQEGDVAFGTAMGEAQGMLDVAGSDLSDAVKSAYKTLGTPQSMAETAFEKDKGNWIPVNVYNEGELESTYMLHRDVAGKLKSEAFTGEEGSYESHFFDAEGGIADEDISKASSMNVDVTPVGIGKAFGKELHTSLSDTVSEYEKQFMTSALTSATDVYGKGVKEIESAYGVSLEELRGQQGILTGYETERDVQYEAERTKFTDRLSTLKSIFGNIEVG